MKKNATAVATSPSSALLVARLKAMFLDESRYAIREDEGDGALFPDGTRVVSCSNWARYVRRVLGERARIHGYFAEDNPGTIIGDLAGGHDFAIVDERYIVDPWAALVEYVEGAGVLDLLDPNDSARIEKLYGDPARWTRCLELETDVDGEKADARQAALEGTSLLSMP